jgi:hypothetical protein
MKLTIEITPFGIKRVFEYEGKTYEEYERAIEGGSKTDGKCIEVQLQEAGLYDEDEYGDLSNLMDEGLEGDQFEIMMAMNEMEA